LDAFFPYLHIHAPFFVFEQGTMQRVQLLLFKATVTTAQDVSGNKCLAGAGARNKNNPFEATTVYTSFASLHSVMAVSEAAFVSGPQIAVHGLL
jgi:hypothetical protein